MTVSLYIQPADPTAATHRILPDPGVHSATRLLDVARKSHIHPTAVEPCRSALAVSTTLSSPLDAMNLLHRLWYPLLEKAGLRRRRFHDLRHTYASLLLQRNESPVYVKDQLGHSSIQITVDLYGHLVPGANRGAVDRLATDTSGNLSATGKEDQGGERERSVEEDWSRGRELNPRPTDYESVALPLSYPGVRP